MNIWWHLLLYRLAFGSIWKSEFLLRCFLEAAALEQPHDNNLTTTAIQVTAPWSIKHILLLKGERLEVTAVGGLGHFHFNRLPFGKKKKKKPQMVHEDFRGRGVYLCVRVNLCRSKCVREAECFSHSAAHSSGILLFLSQPLLVHCYLFITLWPRRLLTRRLLTLNSDPLPSQLRCHIFHSKLWLWLRMKRG